MSANLKILIPEHELVRKIQQKDKLALEYLYERYSGALYGVIFRIVKSDEVASELLNDAFLRFWEKAHTYDGSRGRLYTWMVNIARNLAIDKSRSREFSRAGKTDSMQSFVYPERHMPSGSLPVDSIGLAELLEKLKPEQREIIDWMYFQGYTQSEIEKEFNIPLGTVKTRLRAGMKLLRKLVGVDS